jgi:hypothetical protein
MRAAGLVLLVLLAGCGEELVCGEGTHAEGDSCQASLSPQCGPGTRLENGSCVPDEGGGATCGDGTHLEGETCVPDIDRDGNASRFFDVNLTSPPSIVEIANAPLRQSFMTGENLVFVGAYQPGNGLRVFGGVGTRAEDGSYLLDRSSAFDTPCTLDAQELTTAPFIFSMLAFGADEPMVLLDAEITNGAMVSPEGIQLVASGTLTGVLTPENAGAVYIETAGTDLRTLLDGASAAPDVDRDGNGSKESWRFALTFTTVPVWLF